METLFAGSPTHGEIVKWVEGLGWREDAVWGERFEGGDSTGMNDAAVVEGATEGKRCV